MANETRRVTGLNNVSETWDQNEQKRAEQAANGTPHDAPAEEVPAASELDQIIREEATAYDNENKEDRLLGGDRATRNDDTTERD